MLLADGWSVEISQVEPNSCLSDPSCGPEPGERDAVSHIFRSWNEFENSVLRGDGDVRNLAYCVTKRFDTMIAEDL